MTVGGYIMVDCAGLDLTLGSTPQTINGLYDRVQEAMESGKEIVAINCKWGTLPVTPISLFAIQILEDTVYCTSSTLQIVVTDEDSVTINNMAPSDT